MENNASSPGQSTILNPVFSLHCPGLQSLQVKGNLMTEMKLSLWM